MALEVRSAYGYYGSFGGVTGENPPMPTARVPYREYKTKWKDHKIVDGTYDPSTKTIELYFTDEEMKQKTNLGNRYQIGSYYFIIEIEAGCGKNGWGAGVYNLEFKAKNDQNAERNARQWAKKMGYKFIRQSTFAEHCNHKAEERSKA